MLWPPAEANCHQPKGLYQKSEFLSFPRKRESITYCFYWMPASAGMTDVLGFGTYDTAPTGYLFVPLTHC